MTVVLKCSCCSVEQLDRAEALFLFCLPFLSPKWQLDCGIQTCQQAGRTSHRPGFACLLNSSEEAFGLQSDSKKNPSSDVRSSGTAALASLPASSPGCCSRPASG